MIRAALLLLALTAPAAGQPFVDRLHCWAYPHHDRCQPPVPDPAPPAQVPAEPVPAPVQTPAPLPPPVQAAPPPPTPQATPAPPQAVPAPAPTYWIPAPPPPRAAPVVVRTPPKAKPRVKTKAVPTKPKRKRVDNSGPDLPWPCWMVRLHAGTKTCAELAAEGKRRNVRLSFKQLHQAATCIGRCFP